MHIRTKREVAHATTVDGRCIRCQSPVDQQARYCPASPERD